VDSSERKGEPATSTVPDAAPPAVLEPRLPRGAPAAEDSGVALSPERSAARTVVTQQGGPHWLVRSIWFVLVGWWATALLLSLAYLLGLSVIGLPIAFMLFNVVPSVLTLRGRNAQVSGELRDGTLYVTHGRVDQRPFLLRAVWFLLVGWWLSGLWIVVGYAACLTILLLPLGILMLNRIPAIMTLRRN
jgi:uncharacterized membrane protein YccF (DUF307 family)